MATASVLQFMQKTAEDETLRHQLEELLGVGDGNISSEADLDPAESAALKGERAPVVAEFAAQQGYDFSVSDLIVVVDAFEKHQSGELSDADFAKLVGVSTSDTALVEGTKVTNPMKRLTRYLGKTYLGIDA
ncbi:MAG: hypothetical protein KME07_16335 [Pegethrix bostrychoides GSE-TBD4-15B]|jgi:hypothetical protein|uniref:Uncharacterized protein n=1 Tax=Pegethrix bostrychoides GSE-TBD4-15B TaxID=2839662 RepID=A0A951U5P7_9CYAN|nr:hypothetical protein [Pegethrix bostrychoides GSE-TBD4-15B]